MIRTGQYQVAWAMIYLFCLLFAIYCLSYSGVPITDDEELFASVAQNLGRNQVLDANAMFGNERLSGRFRNTGLAHVALAASLYPLIEHTRLGFVQAAFLLTPLYISLTALIVMAMALRGGYGLRTALFAGLIFGLGTIVWPYAKTFFREPLAMFLFAASWFAFDIAISNQTPQTMRKAAYLLFAVLFGLALLTKEMLLLTLPFFIILGWKNIRQSKSPQIDWMKWLAIGLLGGLLILGLYLVIMEPWAGIFRYTRFKISFLLYVWQRLLTLSHAGFPGAVIGSLISPGKGLLTYSPILLLSVIAAITRPKENSRNHLLAWSFTLIIVIIQALIYDAEWWNSTWGTRFLLPVLPILIVAGLPAINLVRESKSRTTQLAFFGLVGFSLITEIGGVLVNPQDYNAELIHRFPSGFVQAMVWNLDTAPILGHWRLLLAGQPWELAISYNFEANTWLIYFTLVVILSVLVLATFGLWRSVFRPSSSTRIIPITGMTMCVTCCLPIIMLYAFRYEPRFFGNRPNIQEAAEKLNHLAVPGDVLIVGNYLSPGWQYWLNYGRASVKWYSLPMNWNKPVDDHRLDPGVRTLMDELATQYDRIWLLMERFPGESNFSSEELYLSRHYPKLGLQDDVTSSDLRLALYSSR